MQLTSDQNQKYATQNDFDMRETTKFHVFFTVEMKQKRATDLLGIHFK